MVAVTDRTEAEQMFAVPLHTIAWMDRAAVLSPAPPGSVAEPHYLDSLLGPLPPGHSYFLRRGKVLALDDVQHPLRYDAGLRWTAVWISDAHGDHQVYTPAVMTSLVDEGAARSVALGEGVWTVELLDGTERRWEAVEFARSGHQIPQYQPIEITAAIEGWLSRVMAVDR